MPENMQDTRAGRKGRGNDTDLALEAPGGELIPGLQPTPR